MRASDAVIGMFVLLHLMIGGDGAPASASDRSLILEQTIPLEGVAGRLDHMAIDLARQRLFVAELGNDSVDIVDLQAGRVLRRIGDLKEPQGVAYISGQDLIVVANGGDGSVRLLRGSDQSPLGEIALGQDADNVRVDPATGQILVGYGDGSLAIIEPVARSRLADIALAGHPESFQIDPVAGRVFANVPNAGQIAVVDLQSRQQIAAWKSSGFRANFPMAFDPASGLLAVAFRSPSRLALLDRTTGELIQAAVICGDADDVFFDRKRDRVYVSCGDGRVSVMQRGPEGVRLIEDVRTSGGARTALFVPDLDRLFVAAPATPIGSSAAVLVFRPAP